MSHILVIVGDPSSLSTGDENIAARLTAAGHTVEYRDEDAPEIDEGFDGFVISDSSIAANVGSKYATVTKPCILLENGPWVAYGMTSATGTGSGTQWTVTSGTPLSGGLSGTRTVFTTSVSTNAAQVSGLGAGAIIGARWSSDTSLTSYWGYEAGGEMAVGVAPARRVALRFTNTVMGGQLTADGLTLLDAAIAWAFESGEEEVDANDTAEGADAAAVTVQIPVDAEDTAVGADSAVAGQPQDGDDTATTGEQVSMDADVQLLDERPGVDTLRVDADLDGGTDPAAASDQAEIIIPAPDSAGEGAWSYHVDADLQLADFAGGHDGAAIETLWGDLVISLWGVDPDSGDLFALPDFTSLTLSPERNSRGSIELHYPADGLNFERLRECITDSRDLEVEIWTIGSPLGARRGYLQEAAGDDTAEGAVWQFGGGFLELRMDETVVYPQGRGSLITNPNTGELEWSNPKQELILHDDSPGDVMVLLMQQAHDRGALDDIDIDFDGDVDSNGDPWEHRISAKFAAGSTYTQILDKLVEFGVAEWAIEWTGTGKVLKLWNPEGRGVDRTTGARPVILRKARNLMSAPRKWSVRESATTVLAAGSEGIYDDASDPTTLARRGRRIEAYSSLGNATDEAAVLAWAQAELETRKQGTLEVTHGLGFLPGEPRPIIAFDVGDWVYSQVDNVRERLRVVQWTLTVDAQRQPSGTVTLNDTVTDTVVKLQRRLNQIAAGEVVVGASEPTDLGEEDRTPPAAPQGLVASSIAYQDPEHGPGQTLAMVTVGWLPVTTNADGSDSPLVQAAVYVRDKLSDEIENPPDPEDEDAAPLDPDTWTWKDCPRVVQDFAPQVRALWVADGSPNRLAWLSEYIAEATQTPTAADDVAGYRVRYSYVGLEQVGGLPSSDPFPDEERVYYEATPPSGTTSTQFSFGNIEGGARLRIEVAAFDRSGNQSAWSTVWHDCENDTTPPPTPSAPAVKVWFRTLDVSWDGLGAEGEVMPVDLSHARVWVSQGASMTLPDEVAGPVEFDPAETGPQYVRDLPLGAGTTNIPGLPYGPGWYVALQTVDRSGNASPLSEVVGPFTAEQLFPDDLRESIINDPNMIASQTIGTAHIVDAAIIGAKIAEATIEEAHIASVNAGSITAGTLSATLTVTGSLWTSLNPNENRLGFGAFGMQLYRGSTLVGEWRTSDGSMLVTGTYRSGLSGQRIHIDPDGTMSFYATAGANPSRIVNEGNDVVWRGPLTSGRSGRLNVNTLGVGLNYSQEQNLLDQIRAEFLVLDRQTRMTAPFMSFQVDRRWSSPVGGVNSGRRVQFSTLDSDGDFITRSGVSYITDNDGDGGMVGNDAGWKFERLGGSSGDGRFMVTNGNMTDWGVGRARGWEVTSSEAIKTDIEDARRVIDPLEVIRNARARKYRFRSDTSGDVQIGVIAEELPELLQRPAAPTGEAPSLAIDLASQIGVLWAAINQLLDQEVRSVNGRVSVPRSTYRRGDSLELEVTWDEEPPEVPSDITALPFFAMPTADGNVRVKVVPGSATLTGCRVQLDFDGTVAVTGGQLAAYVEVVGRYIYTPPPPEESS